MKLLIVTPLLPPEPGGPAYYSVALKESLEKKGHDVSMVAFREVRKYPSGIRHLILLYKVLFASRGVDGIFIFDTVSVAVPAVLAGCLMGKKTVVRVGGDFVWEQYIERSGEKILLSEFYLTKRKLTVKEKILIWVQKNIVFKLVTKIVFNTDWQRGIWEEPYKIKKNKTAIIENMSNKSNNLHKGGGGYICAWRPTAFKNIDTLKVAHDLTPELNMEQCKNIKLEIFKSIPREELHKRMITARALIIPSLSELYPNMASEAIAIGLPVLLTNDCGVRERFGNVVVWINPKDPKDIAEKMCKLMNEEEYKKVKEKTKTFSFIHSYDDIAKEFLDILSEK